MDLIKKQPMLVAVIAFVAGLLLGWLGIGWGVWPVEYVNADIAHLRADLKLEYVRLVAAAYTVDFDTQAAAQRISALCPDPAQAIADTLGSPQTKQAEQLRVAQLQVVLEASGALKACPAVQTSLLDQFRLPLLGCGLVVVVMLAVGGVFFLRSSGGRRGAGARSSAAAARAAAQPPLTDYGAPGAAATPTGTPAVAQFMTTYVLGDDTYDDSFSIDGPDGSFLGECGMGISETIGVGDPKKVTAFEVWLFDKNDIRTVTKVVMSEHAFRDDALKSRLASKGEPIMARPGDTIQMETQTLVVTARVVDMAYGGGALPPNSYFERLTIELACFPKPAAPEAAPA